MDFPESVMIPVADEIELEVVDTGGSGTPVVLCHGFPELAFSWRHQVGALADAGYRAIAPNQRGYGTSSAPEAIDAYGLDSLTGDLVGLLDALEIERAVFVGHDWGGFVVWAMPVLHPDRCLGVAGVCTPYMQIPRTDMLRMLVNGQDERMYMLWFQDPGVAEGVLDEQVELMYRAIMQPARNPEDVVAEMMQDGELDMNPFRRLHELERGDELILTEDELRHFVETFQRTGFRGGINWYRNIDANADRVPDIGTRQLDLPTLMLCAEWDAALPPSAAEGMKDTCSDLELHLIAKAGHFVQQDSPEAVSDHLVDWLQRRFPLD